MKSVVKHDAGFTGHNWLGHSIGCSVNEAPESSWVHEQVNSFLTTREAWCAQHDQMFITVGTGIKVVARRVLCFPLVPSCREDPSLWSMDMPILVVQMKHNHSPQRWSFTLCQLQLSQVMPQCDWGGRALQKLFPAGSWSWGQPQVISCTGTGTAPA